jgi:hypothetical protein
MKLTDEQYRLTADAGYKATGWAYSCDKMTKETHRKFLEAAADHLPGKPLEPPTTDEVEYISATWYTPTKIEAILRAFVERRSAPPVPVDKRREPIFSIVCKMHNDSLANFNQMTDAILAALDAAEGKKG